ncbi:MAG: DUF262 domain-containing protein [Bradymonadia bacterium]
MSEPQKSARPEARSLTVEAMLREIQSGRFRVPHFQRAFKWKSTHICNLFDSLYQGYPIGSLLVSEDTGAAEVRAFGPVTVESSERHDAWFIVDGQQRVVSIAGALLHPDDHPRGDVHAIWFDLETETFHRLSRREPPPTWVPLNAARSFESMLRWLTSWPLKSTRPELVSKAQTLVSRLLGYTIPIYVLRNADRQTLVRVFERINTFGVAMRRDEVFDALNSRGQIRPIEDMGRRLEREGFGAINPGWLEQIAQAVIRAEPTAASDHGRAVALAEPAIRRTLTFLREDACIPHVKLLPHKLPFIVLPGFFLKHPHPTPRVRTLLTWWLWRGTLSDAHSRPNNTELRRLWDAIDEDQAASAQRIFESTQQSWTEVSLTPQLESPWNAGHATSKHIAAAIVAASPLHPSTGAPIWPDEEALGDPSKLFLSPFGRGGPISSRFLLTDPEGLPLTAGQQQAAFETLYEASASIKASHGLDEAFVRAIRAGDDSTATQIRHQNLAPMLRTQFEWLTGFGRSTRPAVNSIIERAHKVMAS